MKADELRDALRQLDTLYEQMNSVRALLLGEDNGAGTAYVQVKSRIEAAFPGMRVLYVNIAYRRAHGLFPPD